MGKSAMNGDVEVIFTPWPYDAVARGVALLDEQVPGWRERVDLRDLDMADCELCVLGQLFGDYMDGLDVLLPEALGPSGAHPECEVGFDLPRPPLRHQPSYEALANAWREAIAGGSK